MCSSANISSDFKLSNIDICLKFQEHSSSQGGWLSCARSQMVSFSFSSVQTARSWLKSRSEWLSNENRERTRGGKDWQLAVSQRSQRRKRVAIVAGGEMKPWQPSHCWPTLRKWALYEAWETSVKRGVLQPPLHTHTHMETHWLIVQSQHSLSPFSFDHQTHTMKALFQLPSHNWEQKRKPISQSGNFKNDKKCHKYQAG